MNQENIHNYEIISSVLDHKLAHKIKNEIKILDVCCGVFDNNGTSYDPEGIIYQPLVAQGLAEQGYNVTGIDFREYICKENKPKFNHLTNIDILDENWHQKLESDWDVLIFLRSWDTPEIILHYQQLFKINDINLLSLEIAKIYLPIFAELLLSEGLFITTDICNFVMCDDDFEIALYKNQISQLMKVNDFDLMKEEKGISFYKKLGSK